MAGFPANYDANESTRVLLAASQDGDRRALELLLARYRPHLMRWAHGRLPGSARHQDDTHDLVQDALIQFYGRIDEFQAQREGSLIHYLHTIILNSIRSRIRHARVRERHEENVPIPQRTPSPLEEAVGSDTVARYERAMEKLSVGDQQLVRAHVDLGISHAELAELTNKPSANAARMALQRAIERLAREMSALSGDGHEA